MRDYLSPAKKVVERVVPHPAAVRSFIMKRRSFVFLMGATFIVITTLGFVTVRAIVVAEPNPAHIVKEEGKTATMSTTHSSDPEPSSAPTEQKTEVSVSSPSSSSETKTTITVNDQPIDVPANGSTSQTITNENGTTHIDVSTNSDSNGNSYSSSFVTNSTNLNSSSSSFSQNTSITTQ